MVKMGSAHRILFVSAMPGGGEGEGVSVRLHPWFLVRPQKRSTEELQETKGSDGLTVRV